MAAWPLLFPQCRSCLVVVGVGCHCLVRCHWGRRPKAFYSVNQLILPKLKEVPSREPTDPTWWKGKASSKVLRKRICWFPSVSLAYFLEKDRLFQNLKKSLASKPVAIGHFASKVTESSFSLLKVIQIYAQHGPSNIACSELKHWIFGRQIYLSK